MVEKQVKIKTTTDPKALDALLEKLEKTVDLEEETGKITIKPDADTGEIEALLDSLVEVQEVANKPIKPDIEVGGLTRGIGDFGSKAGSVFEGIGSRCDSLGEKFSNLSSTMGGIVAGIGLAEMATSAWEGATEKQTNQLLLSRKYGDSAAQDISDAISSAVTKTPGDDQFLSSMLSNASLKEKMDSQQLDAMASSIADYQTMSKASGSSTFEAQGEIRNYLMTGETGRMKDTPLSQYMDELEGASTVTERVDALNQALDELGYSGASGMSSAANSMETFKGTIQNALSSVGMAFLPAIQGLLDKFLALDDALGGNLSKGLVIVGGGFAAIVAGAGALGAILPAIGNGFKAIGTGIDILTKGPQIVKGLISGFQSFSEVITIMREAESLGAGINAVYSASLEAEGVAAATATEPTAGLAVAENSLLLPILLVIAAIVALVAILWYLYNNNEQVRQAVDQLIVAIKQFMAAVWEAIQPVIQFVQQAIAKFMEMLPGIQAALQPVFDFIMDILAQLFVLGINHVTNLVTTMTVIFQTLAPMIQSVFSTVWSIISGAISTWNQATTKAREIRDGIMNAFSGISGKVQSAFSGVTNAITQPFQSAYNTVKPLIDSIKWAVDNMGLLGSSGIDVGSAGVTVGSAGISAGSVNGIGSANSNLMSNVSTSGGTTNISLNGIIEESAGEFIVRKINDEIYRQNVLRGL